MPPTSNSTTKKLVIFVLPYFVGKSDALGPKNKSYLAFPYGPLTISNYIKRHAAESTNVEVIDLNIGKHYINTDLFSETLKNLKPDVVGFNFMFDTTYEHLKALTKKVREWSVSVPIIIGGAAATTAANEILDEISEIDAVCYSEGEVACLKLLENLDKADKFDQDPWITRTKPGASPVYVASLDEVIHLEYSENDIADYSMKQSFSPFARYRNQRDLRQFFLVTSRGCPFKCTFCAEPSLHGANMRYASVDAIIQHLDSIKDRFGLDVLTIYDDQLLLDTTRAKDLFRRLKKYNCRIEMPNGVTAVFIDDELAELMRCAGVDTVTLAIESGSDYVLRKIIKKPMRIPKLFNVMEKLRKFDFFVQGFFVLGMPGERNEHRAETLSLIEEIDLDWASFSIASPIRGSELYRQAQTNGWLPKHFPIGGFINNTSVLNIPGENRAQIEFDSIDYNIRYNFINNRAMRIGAHETAKLVFEEVIDRAENHAYAHFSLAQALKNLGDNTGWQQNMQIARQLYIANPKWATYANDWLGSALQHHGN